ncbi:MAG: phosphomannomutase [Thermoleophilia bacterium]|nr:phosphomannomutase [Thermoleophilia bacterium]
MRSGLYVECFKAYDVRGRVPGELNASLAEFIGRAYAGLIHPGRVAVGHDIRETGPELVEALCRGLVESGVDVIDIGLVGTEEVYFATFSLGLDGGVMVTASHNPRDYNGMKFTREKARPISADTGLLEMEQAVMKMLREDGYMHWAPPPWQATRTGTITHRDIRPDYIEHLLTYVDPADLRPLRIVVNAGNGGAGPVIDLLEQRLPFTFIKLNHEPDGSFPSGVPNPMLVENRTVTAEAVVAEGADLGIAWDGDFDRCFFFDEKGNFVEGYYLVGLLAERALKRHPGGVIINDPRLVWNTREMVSAAGGTSVMSKSGHAFIKEKMREVDGVYGGEMSAHHYFKEFSYCDSGMIPWLQITAAMSEEGRPLSRMVEERIERYPVSGEINLTLGDPAAALAAMRERYEAEALGVDDLDGLSVEFPTWRFNVRMSNTEPVVRVNVETRGDKGLLRSKTEEVLRILEGLS